jgi:hypothetical protein
MTSRYERLVDLRSAELRHVSGPRDAVRARRTGSVRAGARSELGHFLMRVGERLAAPSGTPVPR